MSSDYVLQVHGLKTYFPIRQSLVQAVRRGALEYVKAVDDVSFDLRQGEVLAIVGESGCGKTTIARTLIGLEELTAGEILFEGQPLEAHQRSERRSARASGQVSLKQLRRQAQMIFQDPYESLNPRATIMEIVAEPLEVHRIAPQPEERLRRIKAALEEAGLRPAEDYLLRFPHELSGGQRQRVVIAAAMALQPRLLIADEPVSMLDLSIRAEILNLLRELRQTRGVSIIFITHDLSTVSYFADHLVVMYLGRIVESGPARQVLANPQHPYTRALISVIPVPNPRLRREHVILQGETPNPINLPSGCRFHPRCPAAIEACKTNDPAGREVAPGHTAACLLLQ